MERYDALSRPNDVSKQQCSDPSYGQTSEYAVTVIKLTLTHKSFNP